MKCWESCTHLLLGRYARGSPRGTSGRNVLRHAAPAQSTPPASRLPSAALSSYCSQKDDVRTFGTSVAMDHPWYGIDQYLADLGEAPALPEEKDGPVRQPGSMLGLSLGFGLEFYGDGSTRLFHVSRRKKVGDCFERNASFKTPLFITRWH